MKFIRTIGFDTVARRAGYIRFGEKQLNVSFKFSAFIQSRIGSIERTHRASI